MNDRKFAKITAAMSKAVSLGVFSQKQVEDEYCKNLDILQSIIDTYINGDISLYEVTQKACGDLPDGYSIVIDLEKDAGSCELILPNDEKIDGYLDDKDFAQQIMSLVDQAIEIELKGI